MPIEMIFEEDLLDPWGCPMMTKERNFLSPWENFPSATVVSMGGRIHLEIRL